MSQIFYVKGPYEIMRDTGEIRSVDATRLKTGRKNTTLYRHRLQKVNVGSMSRALDAGEMVVDKVIDKRRRNRNTQYLIKWFGLPRSFNSWEVGQDSFAEAIEEYETR
eukprot:TRINITY_DN6919_c2_g1_i2.p3 TRINITY_DN6919_c2_g1~~TRINITY_DN6919_c2_g1_i2.p3  ORF type:complete len:108 (+),score=15.21 TRINITY_DN6919_c2_g1_i2:343-666(+)